ncbi:mechanosensitive ion channel [bacterium]|nr:mechanosensitive ion channel [bacterium]
MEDIFQKILIYITQYGIRILFALIIFFAGKFLARTASNFLEKLMLKSKIDKTLTTFSKNFCYFGFLLIVTIAAVNKLGVETTSLVAMVGAAGLAVGLALQGSLANFAAGVLLVIFKPFKVDDVIDVQGTIGTVKEIQIFNTIIMTPDNKQVILPNSKITNDKVVNFSSANERRIDLTFDISYTDNIKKAKEILAAVLSEDKRLLKDPKPFIAVSQLGESSVTLICRPWVKPENYWDAYFDLIENGKLALENAGITIPFPQQDIYIKEVVKNQELGARS